MICLFLLGNQTHLQQPPADIPSAPLHHTFKLPFDGPSACWLVSHLLSLALILSFLYIITRVSTLKCRSDHATTLPQTLQWLPSTLLSQIQTPQRDFKGLQDLATSSLWPHLLAPSTLATLTPVSLQKGDTLTLGFALAAASAWNALLLHSCHGLLPCLFHLGSHFIFVPILFITVVPPPLLVLFYWFCKHM
jgi:hypothetical protein